MQASSASCCCCETDLFETRCRDDRLERAIGVIYRPESERLSHYFRARLPEQFDAVLHIDQTAALEPLERWAYDEVDVPETYPTGI
jgi:erythromycin esterase-like protein